MAGKHEFNESFEIRDAEWSSSTVTITSGGTNWAVPICAQCNTSPCICNAVAPLPNTGQVQSWTIGGNADEKLDALMDKLSVCQVCGVDDCFVLCSVCVEAVKLARNRWLDEFRKEIAAMAD